MALIAHWPLDGRLDDISGNGYNLTENKGLCYFIDDPERGKCLTGNGTADSLDALGLTTNIVDFKAFTVSFWLRGKPITVPSGGNYSEGLFGNKFGNTDLVSPSQLDKRTFNIFRYPNDYSIHSFMNNTESVSTSRINGLNLSDRWVHVSITNDGQTFSVFKNGSLVERYKPVGTIPFYIVKNNDPISVMIKDSKISDVRLYNSALTSSEIEKVMEGSVINLDFKYAVPPTVNWLDNTNKILSKGGNGITIVDTNTIKATKVAEWTESPQFNIPFKDFTISFKLNIIRGTLKRIGGHALWNGTDIVNKKYMKRCSIGPNEYNYDWMNPPNLQNPLLPGTMVEIVVTFSLPSIPTWESNNWFAIQPNRGLTDLIEYEMTDLQIEEGVVKTPFCKWRRDYIEIIDTGIVNKSITYTPPSNKTTPSIRRDRINISNGTPWALDFTSWSQLVQLQDVYFRTDTTLSTVVLFRSIDTTKEYWIANQYIESNVNRFILGVKNGVFWILYGGENLNTNINVQINTAYNVVAVMIGSNRLKIYVNGTVAATVDTMFTPLTTNGGIIIGNGTLNTEYYVQDNIISDFRLYPYSMSDSQVLEEYDSLKQYVTSLASAFEGCVSITEAIPQLWVTHSNTDGTNCFTGVVNAPNYGIVPLNWGGRVKPMVNTIGHACMVQRTDFIGTITVDLREPK